MTYNFHDAHALVDSVMSTGADTKSGLEDILTYCRSKYPEDSWDIIETIAAVNYDNPLYGWLSGVLKAEPPSTSIATLWFGLHEIESGYGLYVAGVDKFVPEDLSGDWLAEPTYWPTHRYAPSDSLTWLSAIYHHDQLGQGARSLSQYIFVLGYSCLAVADTIRAIEPAIILKSRASRGIVVGFDDGDFVVLGTVDGDGLRSTT